jgi:hypothetical protein
MKIATNASMTAAELRALILGTPDDTVIEFVKTTTPKPIMNGECWCGCGGATKGRFVPGHDSKFHGLAKKVARGQAEMPDFVHADAEADFMKWHDAEVAKLEAAPKPAPKVKAAPKAAPVAKAATPVVDNDPEFEVEEIDEETNDEVEEGMLDPSSDEFKALIASVTMS